MSFARTASLFLVALAVGCGPEAKPAPTPKKPEGGKMEGGKMDKMEGGKMDSKMEGGKMEGAKDGKMGGKEGKM